jgi:hypothetical protein
LEVELLYVERTAFPIRMRLNQLGFSLIALKLARAQSDICSFWFDLGRADTAAQPRTATIRTDSDDAS